MIFVFNSGGRARRGERGAVGVVWGLVGLIFVCGWSGTDMRAIVQYQRSISIFEAQQSFDDHQRWLRSRLQVGDLGVLSEKVGDGSSSEAADREITSRLNTIILSAILTDKGRESDERNTIGASGMPLLPLIQD